MVISRLPHIFLRKERPFTDFNIWIDQKRIGRYDLAYWTAEECTPLYDIFMESMLNWVADYWDEHGKTKFIEAWKNNPGDFVAEWEEAFPDMPFAILVFDAKKLDKNYDQDLVSASELHLWRHPSNLERALPYGDWIGSE